MEIGETKIERGLFKQNKNDAGTILQYIFIQGEGTWFFCKKDADQGNYKTGNEVGLHYIELEFEDTTLYQQCQTNVWN
jgi:hypothetical protein